ncbi:ABC transporter ATP-binding protein [Prosthecochloris sp. N3]|uniref:ABC transporter ATP-binding protein n=1 Tax=Prosthecochloris ethylica TaxID=2743976 RepID=A0ABR9XR53_9CHLB|nr:ABC transporter ATP-binding protein [Prosthecochloris ethylica]MBF0586378.1 ABC transporter ATP-binding protein [Prosthecochloris ethylica]MBF0636404.1 ABC transporter ATP-binding protein [Prosthecochloris ethylica]NUK47578.1 ABC transporter ATP-binding protein [Prosthecochloris ethylica]
MIVFDKVTRSFPHNGQGRVTILDNLSFSVPRGEFLCILGPSGCGKTTLLNLIAGFLMPDSGTLSVRNTAVTAPGPDRAMVFQEPTLFPWLTVLQNVMFGLRRQGITRSSCRKQALHHLEITGLAHAVGEYPFALSGGMRQRVAIARVLALNPDVLLMDEPFSALDANTRERLQDELLALRTTHSRATIVYVTHSVSEAAYLADRIIILGDRGNIARDISVTAPHPRERSSAETLELKTLLRTYLGELCSCIPSRRKQLRPS